MEIIQRTKRFIRHTIWGKEDLYIKKIDKNAPWALVSYIPFVYDFIGDDSFLDEHQSRREAFVINRILNELGYNVYNIPFNAKQKIPSYNFELVFGLEPAFCDACIKYPNALKIYYATGAYYEHQNKMVKFLTDEMNNIFKSHIPYRRIVKEHNACQLADYILQIGNKFTIETYPETLQSKISLIHQSSQATRTISTIRYAEINHFFFMSSTGNCLKGVPLLCKFFSQHPELTLHIVGSIEEDVGEALKGIITPNIILHGFMNVNSDEFLSIVSKCNFMLYPSGSEGGAPGAVLNGMRNGLIPITAQWGHVDEFFYYGYIMKDISLTSLSDGIQWSQSLSPEEVTRRKILCAEHVKRTYNLERFEVEFRQYMNKIIRNENRNTNPALI